MTDLLSNPFFASTFWGFVGGGALLLGAGIGFYVSVPSRVVAGVMAFGAGVLISALSFELMDEAYQQAGLAPTAIGFLLGAVALWSACGSAPAAVPCSAARADGEGRDDHVRIGGGVHGARRPPAISG